jgi:ribosomal protein S18 acetylase RimI-like enzyme
MDITIRKLQKQDYDQLLNLVIEFREISYKEHVSNELLDLIKYKNHLKQIKLDVKRYIRLNPNKATFFVAESERQLIGYIWGNVNQRKGKVLDKIGFIEDWFVKEEYRGKKVGISLWNEMLKWFRKKRCNGIELESFVTNYEAIDIYHKFGFIDRTLRMIRKM